MTTRASTKSEERVATRVRTCSSTGIDIDLAYDTFGDARNPPLVLIMGLGCQMVLWDEELCELLAERFFVIRFDNRDVGCSTKIEGIATPWVLTHILPTWAQLKRTPEPYTLDDMALDTWALVDRVLGPDVKVHLVGASMGGMIAQCATLQNPARVLSLVSIMSTTGARDLPEPDLRTKLYVGVKRPKSLSFEDRLQFRMDLIKDVLTAGVPHDEATSLATTTKSLQRSLYIDGVPRQIAAIVRAKNREPMLRALGATMPPTVVIHGVHDKLLPLPHGVRTAAVIPGARLLVLERMGHSLSESSVRRAVVDAISNPASVPTYAELEANGQLPPPPQPSWWARPLKALRII